MVLGETCCFYTNQSRLIGILGIFPHVCPILLNLKRSYLKHRKVANLPSCLKISWKSFRILTLEHPRLRHALASHLTIIRPHLV